MSEEMSDEVRVMAAHLGGHEDPSHGIQALHGRSPLEELMDLEEGGPVDVDQLRVEAMRRFLLYLFSDGKPRELRYATRRLYAVARGYYPQTLRGITMVEMREIFRPGPGEEVAWREPLRSVLEGDQFDVRDETVGRLMFFLFVDERAGVPWYAMRRLYALAKAFAPEALEGMSLEAMGEVFGEKGARSARARWSARIRVIISDTIEKAGGVAHLKYQKSLSAREKYAAAQMGNQNRKKKEIEG
jgi:hypothetical protein